MSEQELRDEVQALLRQTRELQHERDTWKRKYEGLQAVVNEFLRRATQETVLDIESLQDFLQRTP